MVLTVSDAVVKEAGGYPSQPAGGPNPFLLGVVNKQYSSNKYVNRFYDFYDEVNTAYRTFTHLRDTEGRRDDAAEYLKENADLIRYRKPAEKIRAELAKMNRRIQLVQRETSLDSKEKRDLIDQLNERKKVITKTLFEKIRSK